MATLSDQAVATAVQQTNLRLNAARERRKAQQRAVIVAAGCLILVLVLFVAGKRSAPPSPRLVVTWSQPRDRQTLQPGAVVLLRPGQPLDVSVEHAEIWNLQWTDGNVNESGRSHSWSPASSPATLLGTCRPASGGLRRLVNWLSRPRQVKLQGLQAVPLEGLRRRLEGTSGTIWVFPHIAATVPVAWDERALPLLLSAAHRLPHTGFRAANSELWRLVPSFGGAASPGDDGTYALLEASNIQDAMTTAARTIAAKLPTASIKFVVRIDANPAYGIIRLAFDGKADRAAWIRLTGETAGGPLQWEEDVPADRLNPKSPARIGR